MTGPDLTFTASALAGLLDGVRDEHLDGPTPCPRMTVGDLLAHVHGLSQAFTAAAAKDLGELTASAPTDGMPDLPGDWRETLPVHLSALSEAWRDPAAWTGMTQAGSVDLPGEVAGLVAADELVVHGWDLARSTGQTWLPGEQGLAAAHAFLVESRTGPVPAELFGPAVEVPPDAPLLDQVVGLAGRDPGWTP